jgi:hypothetical protein
MNLVKNIEQYDENSIFFCEPIKNNIMNDGNFIRILYSNRNLVLNGIYIHLSFNDLIIEKHYNKFKCIFNTNIYKKIITEIKTIEENILTKIKIINKTPQFKIYEQLNNGSIKIFCDSIPKTNCSFILKISGVWETPDQYGLTYKFTKIN